MLRYALVTGLIASVVLSGGLASAQDFREAEAVCNDATRTAADRVIACTRLIDGAAYTDLSDYARAHLSRADASQSASDWDAALTDLDTALDYDPYSYDGYMARGAVLLRVDEPYRAIADFSVAAGLNPLTAMPYAKRGLALYAHREYASAIKDLETALKYDPTLPDARRTLAWILATAPVTDLRNGQRAAELLSDLEDDAPSAQTEIVRAAVRAENGDIEGAMNLYRALALRNQTSTRRIQRYLESAGYYSGPSDGIYSPAVDDALNACLVDQCRVGAPRPAS